MATISDSGSLIAGTRAERAQHDEILRLRAELEEERARRIEAERIARSLIAQSQIDHEPPARRSRG